MSGLLPFDFDGTAVRVTVDEGQQPWFVAKDVCLCLGIEWKGSPSMGPLDDDERMGSVIPTPGGPQEMLTVSESGLYALIFSSRKPEAKRFRKWVTAEVLPAIRQTGGYQAKPVALPSVVPNLKPTLRATAMNTAVQVVKQCGGGETDIDRLYAKYCAMLAPALPGEEAGEDVEDGWETLIQDWADAMLVPNMKSRKQATNLYGLFRSWARRGGYHTALPSMRFWGSRMQERFTKAKIGGLCWYFVSVRKAGGDS